MLLSFGSDTGGYREGNLGGLGRTREELLRWAQLNSLMGLFENGGDNEHRPWKFPQPQLTTSIYKYFVDLHHSLASYLLVSLLSGIAYCSLHCFFIRHQDQTLMKEGLLLFVL